MRILGVVWVLLILCSDKGPPTGGWAMDSPMRKSNRMEEDCSDFSRRNKIQWCTCMESIASISASADLFRELSIEHRGDVCWIEWYRSLILQAWISLCCRLSAVTSAVIQTLLRSLMRSMACCCCCRCCCAVTVPKSSSLLPSKKKSFGEFTRSDELQLLPAGHQAREFRHLHVANIVDLLSQLWSSLLLSQLPSMPS
jgi:hypothetical protein